METGKATFKNTHEAPRDKLMDIISVLLKNKEERKDKDFVYIQKIIKDISFFKQRQMNHQDLKYLCQELQYDFYYKGENVFRFGDHGSKFYIILQGKVEIMVPDKDKR